MNPSPSFRAPKPQAAAALSPCAACDGDAIAQTPTAGKIGAKSARGLAALDQTGHLRYRHLPSGQQLFRPSAARDV